MPAILTIMCVSTENKRQKQKTKPTKQSRKVGKSKERTTKKLKKKKRMETSLLMVKSRCFAKENNQSSDRET